MKTKKARLLGVMILLLLLGACQSEPPTERTPTVMKMNTPLPTETATHTPLPPVEETRTQRAINMDETISANLTKNPGRTLTALAPTLTPTITSTFTATFTPRPLVNIMVENVAQMEELLRIGDGLPEDIAPNPNGEILAVATSLGIELYDFDRFELVSFQSIYSGGAKYLAWSPEGSRLASADGSGSAIKIWDPSTWEELLSVGMGKVDGIAWSPDGKWLLAYNRNSERLVILDVTSGEISGEVSIEYLKSAVWSADSTKIAIGATVSGFYADECKIHIWDVFSRMKPYAFRVPDDIAKCVVTWSPDGERFAVEGYSVSKILDATYGFELASLNGTGGGNGNGKFVSWSPDGRWLATGRSGARALLIWNTSTWEVEDTLAGHNERLVHLAWSSDSERLVSLGDDLTVRIWDIVSGVEIRALEGYSGHVSSAALSPDGTRIAVSTFSPYYSLGLIEAHTGARLFYIHTDSHFASNLAWSSNGRWLAEARIVDSTQYTTSYSFRVWEINRDQNEAFVVDEFRTEHSSGAFAWSHDGTQLLYFEQRTPVLGDYGIRIVDVASGDEVWSYWGLDSMVRSLAWSPNGSRIALGLGSGESSVLVLGVGTGSRSMEIMVEGYPNVAWSPDGTRLAISGWYRDDFSMGWLEIWDAANGKRLLRIDDLVDEFNYAAWSPDSKMIATLEGESIAIWDSYTGTLLHKLVGHSSKYIEIFWSLDGTRIMSEGNDGTIRIWGIPEG